MRARRFRGVLPAVMVAALLLCSAAWGERNVAVDRPFTSSTGMLEGWSGLVDGVVDSDSAPGCFATTNDNDFPKHVTIDLQLPHNINRIAVHNSANGNTRGIIISCSLDGENYEELRQFIFPQGEAITLNHRFNDRPAQFVRIEFMNSWGGGLGGDYTIFVREVEVFGTPTGGAGVLAPIARPDGDPLVQTRDVRQFRRWALEGNGELRAVVLGDSFADAGDESWPQMLAERLREARPDEAPLIVASIVEEDVTSSAAMKQVSVIAEAGIDLALVTWGSDLQEWNQGSFRSGLTRLVGRLLEETDALVVLVGPLVTDADRVDVGRRALEEMHGTARLYSLPLVRTEVALLNEDIGADELIDGDGKLAEEVRRVVAASITELLLQR